MKSLLAYGLLTVYYPNHSSPDAEESISQNLFVIIVGVAIPAAAFLYLLVVHTVYWDRGIFPPFVRFTRSNHYEAVLQLTRNIMRYDKEAYKEKIDLACIHLRKWFPDVRGAVKNELRERSGDPVTTKSIAYWLNKKQISNEEKTALFEFLFEVAIADGVIGQREYAELKILAVELKLSVSVLDELVTTFKMQQAERVFEERERQKQFIGVKSIGEKQRALTVLGLEADASMVEVKKAYRKLVMICHPDMIQSGDQREIETAKARFLEIQQAYEYLIGE